MIVARTLPSAARSCIQRCRQSRGIYFLCSCSPGHRLSLMKYAWRLARATRGVLITVNVRRRREARRVTCS